MRTDRTVPRLLKIAILFGVVGLVGEGSFELKRLLTPLLAPPSVPGEAKILEHFAVQHVAFPILGLLLVFAPRTLGSLVRARAALGWLASLAVIVSVPEFLVSRTDLFRPYPFSLHNSMLESLQMLRVGSLTVNLLQLQHLVFAHGAVMGGVVALAALGDKLLEWLSGPRTGEALVA